MQSPQQMRTNTLPKLNKNIRTMPKWVVCFNRTHTQHKIDPNNNILFSCLFPHSEWGARSYWTKAPSPTTITRKFKHWTKATGTAAENNEPTWTRLRSNWIFWTAILEWANDKKQFWIASKNSWYVLWSWITSENYFWTCKVIYIKI